MSKTTNWYSPEVRARAVRLVLDNQGQHSSLAGDHVDLCEDRLFRAFVE